MGIAFELLVLILGASVLAATAYWIVLAPERAKKQRRAAMLNVNRSHVQPWDPDIGARRRER